MSLFKILLSKLFGRKNIEDTTTLQQELNALNRMVSMSLINDSNSSGLTPDAILLHTAKVKKIIITLFNDGKLKMDRTTLDYLLSNIAAQENMIITSGKGYGISNPDIFNSQVGSSILEILKDIKTFVK